MIGMFPLDPVLESCCVVRKIRGAAAVHVVSTLATRYRARHTLCLESIPTLLDFLLKPLFAEHISSVSLCHSFSLPQSSGRGEMFFQTFGWAHPPSILQGPLGGKHNCCNPNFTHRRVMSAMAMNALLSKRIKFLKPMAGW